MNTPYSNPPRTNNSHAVVDFPNQKGTYYDMKTLQERHKEILRRLAIGQSKGNIARDLGVTTAMVRYVFRSTLGSDYLNFISDGRDQSAKSVQDQIAELAPDALSVIRETISGKMTMYLPDEENPEELTEVEVPVPQKLRMDAARDILGRAGYVPPTKVTGEITHAHTTAEIVAAAKAKVLEERTAKVLPAEFVDITEKDS